MFQPFAPKSLDELEVADLEGLVEARVPEGLFVEYKSAWVPDKVARAVSSFANTHGGTLIVGIETDKMLPTKVVGVEVHGDLAEMAVQAIRSSITPVPSFLPRTLPMEGGRSCLVVEVGPGTQPPYLLIRTGVILVRTPTSSEPVPLNDREALDRLFAKGERGRKWAVEQARQRLASIDDSDETLRLWVVPAVEDGLGLHTIIFTKSFLEEVLALIRLRYGLPSGEVRPAGMTASSVTARKQDLGDRVTQITVEDTGMVCLEQTVPQVGSGDYSLKAAVREYLPKFTNLFETRLRYRGDVILVAFNRWPIPSGPPRRQVELIRGPVPLESLAESAFLDSLDRDVTRAMGYPAFEP